MGNSTIQKNKIIKKFQIIKLIIVAIFMLFLSLVINFYAWSYASISQSNAVTDIILSNIRTYNVDGIFLYGTFTLFLILLIYCLKKPLQIPFIIKSIALFIVVRSSFIILTHIWPFPTAISIDKSLTLFDLFNHFSFSGDLFFSWHTGLPFLMALIFRKNKLLRYFSLAISFWFAVIVLLWHLHYSIDVLSAFFISYGIYHINLLLFQKEKKLFDISFLNQINEKKQ